MGQMLLDASYLSKRDTEKIARLQRGSTTFSLAVRWGATGVSNAEDTSL